MKHINRITNQRLFCTSKELLLLFSLFSVAPVHTALCQDYYVDQNEGGTSNSGTEAEPFKDIDQCAEVVEPGDRCIIKDGTYTKGWEAYEPQQSGTQDNPIIYIAAQGHTPTIKIDSGPAIGTGCDNGFVNYFVIDGLRIEGTVLVRGCSTNDRVEGFELKNSEILTGSFSNDGNWSGLFLQDVVAPHIHDNEIHHIDDGENLGAGIRIFRCKDCLFEHNYIHDNKNEGAFDKEGSERNVWRRNIWENNGVVHLKVNNQPDQTTGLYNERTQVYENIFRCTSGGEAEATRLLVKATDLDFYNNTVYQCNGVTSFGNSDGTELNTGLEVYNNIFVGANAFMFERWDATEPEMSDYNLFYETNIIENRFSPPGDEERKEHNTLASWTSAHPEYDANSLETAPQFVNPPSDLHLKETSPARNAGKNGEDLGAYPGGENAITSIDTDNHSLHKIIKVFPNPSSNQLNVEFKEKMSEKISVQLINIAGKKVYQTKDQIKNGLIHLDLDEYESGLYFLLINTNDAVYQEKILFKKE